ncbi:MAG: hypothetical protein R2734_11665 [Nocardioides sp.]
MTRQPAVAKKAEALLGAAVVATAPVAGGDIATATKLRLSDGTTALMKTHPSPPAGFFAAEVRGLRWLEEGSGTGGVAVRVLGCRRRRCVILRWVEQGHRPRTPRATSGGARGHARDRRDGVRPGRRRLHRPIALAQPPHPPGLSSTPPGACSPTSSSPATAATTEQAAAIEGVVGRLGELVPEEGQPGCTGICGTATCSGAKDGRVVVIDRQVCAGHH